MKNKNRILFAGLSMILLLFDPETAMNGASQGLDLCIRVIVPSLFPFFFLTNVLSSTLVGSQIPLFSQPCQLLGIPKGGESILLLSFLSGYPVGAKIIADTYKKGRLRKETAQSMMRYCSNAGPAFIFGVAGRLFPSMLHAWLLWAIHILSALATACVLPKPQQCQIDLAKTEPNSLPQALQDSIKVCATVCGWILIFKVVLVYIEKLTGCLNIEWINVYLGGLLEISNGCTQLFNEPLLSTRFVLCSGFLAFGGLCVLLQTSSVADNLGIRHYLEGKLFQLTVSMLLAALISRFLFPESRIYSPILVMILILLLISTIIRKRSIKRYGNLTKNAV